MNLIIKIFIFLLIVSCSSTNKTYWCGDHPCINNQEKEAYFKKTMIVEIKNIEKYDTKKNSEIEKIMEQAKKKEKNRILNERNLAKQAKYKKKLRKKREKEILKQKKTDLKKKLKESKKLKKQAKKNSKIKIQEQNEILNEIKKENIIKSDEIIQTEFNAIVKKITERNKSKPYPELNNIPN